MAPLRIENRPFPDGHYVVTYHNRDGTERREEGVTKDRKVVNVWKYGEGNVPGEPQILAVTQSTVLLPGERARVLSSSYGESGAFILEAVEADQRIIIDGEEQPGPFLTYINGVTISQVTDLESGTR